MENDLISKKALLEQMDRMFLGADPADHEQNGIFKCLVLVKEAPSVEAEPKWISVKERLPESDGKYIVCTAKGSVYCTRFKAYSHGGNFQTDINTHVTHWMPLPEPPMDGGAEND